MLGDNWYHGLTRKYIAYFGAMFNDIFIDRTLNDGTLGARIKVPIAYSLKEQVLIRLREDPLINRKAQNILPTMAFEITSLQYNKDRKLPTLNMVTVKSESQNRLKYQYVPVPYDIGISLYILIKNAEDGAKIIEQILPKFPPALSMTLELIPEMGIKQDIPIVFGSIEPIASYKDEQYKELVAYIWTLQFTIQAYYYGPVKEKPIIKFSNATFYGDSALAVPAFRDAQTPGLTANGTPTTDPTLSIDPNVIWIDDDWGYATQREGLDLAT